MKILKYIVLEMLLLLVLILCGISVVKVLDVVFQLQFENIGSTGFVAGLFAWIILLIGWRLKLIRNR